MKPGDSPLRCFAEPIASLFTLSAGQPAGGNAAFRASPPQNVPLAALTSSATGVPAPAASVPTPAATQMPRSTAVAAGCSAPVDIPWRRPSPTDERLSHGAPPRFGTPSDESEAEECDFIEEPPCSPRHEIRVPSPTRTPLQERVFDSNAAEAQEQPDTPPGCHMLFELEFTAEDELRTPSPPLLMPMKRAVCRWDSGVRVRRLTWS